MTTDGFLYPNEHLRREDLMERKGFPDSYDVGALLRFLSAIKSGQPDVRAPVYSHLTYDVLPGEFVTIDRPDILIFEGLNVLQPRELPKDGKFVPFVSDFFDFSIYIDADEELIHSWYINRFMRLRETAFRNPHSFFHRYAPLSEDAARTHRRGPVGQHQPEESQGKHPADAAARRPDPAQGRASSGRGSGAPEAVIDCRRCICLKQQFINGTLANPDLGISARHLRRRVSFMMHNAEGAPGNPPRYSLVDPDLQRGSGAAAADPADQGIARPARRRLRKPSSSTTAAATPARSICAKWRRPIRASG